MAYWIFYKIIDMVIELEKRYEEYLINHGINQDIIHDLNKILENAYDKRIFFRSSLRFFEFLYSSSLYNNLSYFAKQYVEFFIEHHFRIVSETNHIKTLIFITNDSHVAPMSEAGSYVTFEMLPYDLTSRIYGENIDDSKFYKKLFDILPHEYKNEICLETDSFNGDNVGNFSELIKEDNKRIFFTVIDSDKDYPGADYGKTASDYQKEYNKTKPYFCYLKILSVREKENLMPIQFMNISCAEVKDVYSYISTLNEDIRNYYDLKSGIKNTVYNEKKSDPRWNAIYEPVITFAKSNSYFHIEKGKNKYQHVKGVGKNITNDFTKVDKNSYMSLLTNMQRNDLNCVFELICRFGFVYDIQKLN